MSDQYDLAQLGRIIEIHGGVARVDLGGGIIVNANIALSEPKIDDYVLVHAGYVLKVVDMKEAKRMLALWE